MKSIRRKKYTEEDGRCCADCDLFTASEYSGTYFPSGRGGKYCKNIFGICELTEKRIVDCDNYYCKHYQEGKSYEIRNL